MRFRLDPFELAPDTGGALEGRVQGQLDLALVPQVVDLYGDSAGGRLDADATVGGSLAKPQLSGEARISIPAETQTGKLFRLRGKGVKSVRNGETGDLLCRVVLETPVKLTARQRELIEELDASFGGENAHTHSPRNRSWLDGVKQFWDRVTS